MVKRKDRRAHMETKNEDESNNAEQTKTVLKQVTILQTAPEPTSDSIASSVTLGLQDMSNNESNVVDRKSLTKKVKKAKQQIPTEVCKRMNKNL